MWEGAGPDGNIYWLSLGPGGDGQLRKLSYSPTMTITTATASPATGAAPLAVTFAGAATDTDGSAITYRWDFGDGTSSTQPNPSHTYTTNGVYQARLQATSAGGTASSDPIPVTVGTPPTVAITSPADGTTFNAGTSFTFTGTGFDPDTGTALTGTSLSWNVLFLHDAHSHPGATGTGSSLTFPIPVTGHDYTGNTRYLVQLTATNASGVSTTTSITIWPNKTTVNLSSNAASTVTVDNITQNLPFGIDTAVGFQETIAVPATQCVNNATWNFQSWSDGGAISHTITAAPGMNLTATYTDSGAGCRLVVVNHDPIGNFEAVSSGLGGISVKGWTLDPDSTGSTSVHVYVDGVWSGALTADGSRPDVGAAFPGYGDAHGFSGSVPAPGASGGHWVCVYGINAAFTPGTNPLLGCRIVVVNHDPIGNFEAVSSGLGGISVKGWTLDPDSTGSTSVHVYVDGVWSGALTADGSRPDVGAAFPGYGDAHGFSGSVPAPGASGGHWVCVYGINAAFTPGTNPLLGCRIVVVNHDPIGNFEAVSSGPGGISVEGWALDPDSAASTSVHVYIDGHWAAAVPADADRPDVGAAFPGYGAAHGIAVDGGGAARFTPGVRLRHQCGTEPRHQPAPRLPLHLTRPRRTI